MKTTIFKAVMAAGILSVSMSLHKTAWAMSECGVLDDGTPYCDDGGSGTCQNMDMYGNCQDNQSVNQDNNYSNNVYVNNMQTGSSFTDIAKPAACTDDVKGVLSDISCAQSCPQGKNMGSDNCTNCKGLQPSQCAAKGGCDNVCHCQDCNKIVPKQENQY